MKHLITFSLLAALSVGALADEVTLPQGMIPMLPSGTQITSSYLDQNVMSITKDEKPFVVAENNLMFFTATNTESGDELWVSDGTVSGTRMVKDIVPGSEGADPKWLTVVGNLVYFSATTPDKGAELWVTDGTSEGTRMIKDIYEGETGSAPQGLTNFYGKLLFFAMDEESEALPIRNAEVPEKWLWISDGTEDGTKRIADTPTRLDNVDGTCGYIVTANKKGLFIGYDPENNETLWATDGTSQGTTPLLNINPKPDDGNPFLTGAAKIDHMVSIDDRIVAFRAIVTAELYGEDKGVEMWISDGTTAGTKWIGIDINKVEKSGNPGTSDFRQTYAFGSRLYFRATDGIYGCEAWCYDIDQPIVENVNPRMVKDVAHDKGKVSYNAHPSCFYQYQGYIYTATNFTYEKDDPENPGQKISWDAGYHSFARFNESDFNEYEGSYYWCGFEIGPNKISEWCHQFTTVKDIMFWSCQDMDNNIELWKLNGTNGIPTKVVDFPDNGQVFKTRNVNGVLFFMSNGQKQLYRYNVDGSTDYNPVITGIEEKATVRFSVYPNPAVDFINIDSDKEIANVSVTNLTGNLLILKNNMTTVDVRNLNTGIYILTVTFADGSNSVRKIIKK